MCDIEHMALHAVLAKKCLDTAFLSMLHKKYQLLHLIPLLAKAINSYNTLLDNIFVIVQEAILVIAKKISNKLVL